MQQNAPFCVLLNIPPPSPLTAFSLSRVDMYAVAFFKILYAHVRENRHANNLCMCRFMLLPRVRMMQTCTNAYVERGHKLGN